MQKQINQSFMPFLLCAAFAIIFLTSCSGIKTDSSINDPLEKYNRQSLKFNNAVDKALLDPVAKGYRAVTPEAGRSVIPGFGGILDLASEGGFEYQPEDFGQTLATWGVGDGLYIMLPLFGPSTLRDSAGMLVDGYVDPISTYLFNIDEGHLQYTRTGMQVVSGREDLIEVIDDLRKNSFDYYAAVRSAYYQRRQAQIHESGSEMIEIPDYDEFEDE